MSLFLLLDTSTEQGLIAIFDGEKLIKERLLPFGHRHSKELIPEAKALLEGEGIELADLKFVATGIGPGSYTGIRVAAVAAKTIAFALQIPLVGLTSLLALVPKGAGPYAALLDARIGGVYCLKEGESEAKLIALGNVAEELKDVKLLGSPHVSTLKPKWPEGSWDWEEVKPSAKEIGKAAYKNYLQGNFSRDGVLQLLYLRKTQAELEKGLS